MGASSSWTGNSPGACGSTLSCGLTFSLGVVGELLMGDDGISSTASRPSCSTETRIVRPQALH